ncbi:zinc metalloproteinase nas-4-like protein, partial [Dinothrombium tinctorium]
SKSLNIDKRGISSLRIDNNPFSELETLVKNRIPLRIRFRPNFHKKQEFNNRGREERKALNKADFERADSLPQKLLNSNDFLLYSAQFYEGDIKERLLRNAILDEVLKWPNAIIPYEIDGRFSDLDRAVIAKAVKIFHLLTCIRFLPRNESDYDYLYITSKSGCYSSVGRVGGKQELSLGSRCVSVGIVQHEMMHAIGFWHEQSRADRDEYVTVLWPNIIKGMEYNFDKYNLKYIQHLEEPYDYHSIMHYGAYAFSKRGMRTIEPKQKGVSIGQRRFLSKIDIRKINKLYGCKEYLR